MAGPHVQGSDMVMLLCTPHSPLTNERKVYRLNSKIIHYERHIKQSLANRWGTASNTKHSWEVEGEGSHSRFLRLPSAGWPSKRGLKPTKPQTSNLNCNKVLQQNTKCTTKRHNKYVTNQLTDSVQTNSSLEAASCWATREFPKALCNTNIYYRIHKSAALVRIITFYFSKIYLILSYNLRLRSS
jgi:hypothetical protein